MWVTTVADGALVKLNTDLISELYPDLKVVKMASGSEINLIDLEYNRVETKLFPKRKTVAKDDTELHAFLSQLHQLLGNKGTVALTGDRRAGLEKLFKDGFTRDQIILAATNIGQSEWMRGKNDRNTVYAKVDYLFRKSDGQTYNINKWQEVREKKQKPLF